MQIIVQGFDHLPTEKIKKVVHRILPDVQRCLVVGGENQISVVRLGMRVDIVCQQGLKQGLKHIRDFLKGFDDEAVDCGSV
jgi:hypothetical protein